MVRRRKHTKSVAIESDIDFCECADMEKELKQELLLRNAQLKHVSLPPDSLLPGESIHNIAELRASTAVNDKCWKHYRSVVFGAILLELAPI